MTTTRKRTIAALVTAILVLLGSAGAVIAVAASGDVGPVDHGQNYANRYDTDGVDGSPRRTDPDSDDWGWGRSMMGDGSSDYDQMMGPGWAGQGWTDSRSGGGWADSRTYGWNGAGTLSATQAREQAQLWVERYAASAGLGDQVAMPMGYRFLATQDGTVVAMIMVDDDTGAVFGHLRAPAAPR